MKSLQTLVALIMLLGAATALGHAHLQGSTPADGSVLASPPSSIALHFAENARVTAAWIQKGDAPRQKLGPLPQQSAREVTLPLPALTAGDYVVSWRVLGDDGHIMPGQIHFAVSH